MKQRLLSLTTLSVCLALIGSQAIVLAQDGGSEEVLTNEKVIMMTKAGLPASIIVNKIRASKTNFNTNTDELIRLQQAQFQRKLSTPWSKPRATPPV